MNVSPHIQNILLAAGNGVRPSKAECITLLELPEYSPECSLLRASADTISRQRFNLRAMLLAQIGIDIAPCPADCQFCSFAESITRFPRQTMTIETILDHCKQLTGKNTLHSLFLMTMHTFDHDHLLEVIGEMRKKLSPAVHIVLNIGDFNRTQAEEFRDAGANGAYHVRRLREGIDNTLAPSARLKTIEIIKEAGLDWYTCCEPIGPEHSNAEIVEQIFESYDLGCFQNAAMRRVVIPNSRLKKYGKISELRLAQIVSVVTLAGLECSELSSIAVHEPNALGLMSGANCIYAEAGANPRDTQTKTEQSRGLSLQDCEQLLLECGFNTVLLPAGKEAPLSGYDLQTYAGVSQIQ